MQSKMAPLKSATGEVITDQGWQMERWVEHYSNLYSRENTVTPSSLGAIKCMPIMEELNAEPTMDELSKVIDSLAAGKAPGSDSIPPDLIKHCKTTLLTPCMKSSASAGERELCHKTWEMPRSLPCTRTRVREVTVTTTEASLFSASLARSMPGSSWSACRGWLSMSTQNHSVASKLKGLW